MKTFALIILIVTAIVTAISGENLNGIYLGEDVAAMSPKSVAVRITEDGTVIAYRDAIVPGLHDRNGVQVRIRRVVLK